MKLRLRSRETRETIKIDVPETCTVQDLNEAIRLSNPGIGEPTFVYSLNGKDIISVSSSQETLKSLGIASGDLVFFSSCPNSYRSLIPLQEVDLPMLDSRVRDVVKSAKQQKTLAIEGVESASDDVIVVNSDVSNSLQTGEGEYDAGISIGNKCYDQKSLSEHYLLRKVLKEEILGDGCVKKLLVAAVHAVLLEANFARFDPVSATKVDGLSISNEWPSTSTTLSYTLPALLEKNGDIEFVKLRFQTMSRFVNIYASMANGGLSCYRASLDGNRFGPILNLLRRDDDSSENKTMNYEREVYECWKMIKDQLAYPLLIELCEKTHLPSPPCLMLLPKELKLKILEPLPAVDLGRVACVCKELSVLSSKDELWKQKYSEQFGIRLANPHSNWKAYFVSIWESERRAARPVNRPPPLLFPAPHPSFLGGDFDRLPGLPSAQLRYPGFRVLHYRH